MATPASVTAVMCWQANLLKAGGRHELAFREYEAFLRTYIHTKQEGAGASAVP